MNALTGRKKKKYQYYAFLWIAPAAALILVFSLYPAAQALVFSFTDWDLNTATFNGVTNFIDIFTDWIFWKSCLNLIILMGTGLVLGNGAALLLAELLHNLRSARAGSAYRFLFILPALVPGMVNMLIWTKLIFYPGDSGLVNMILTALKLPTSQWYGQESMALFSMVLTGFPWVGGTSFLIYLAGLNNVPESVYEAARLDGAGTFKRIWYMDLPMLKSQFKYFIILGIIGGMQSFSMQLSFTKGGPNYATTVPGYYMYDLAFLQKEFGTAAAVGILLFALTLIITVINNKFIKSTEDALS